jgi:hypothetical protein
MKWPRARWGYIAKVIVEKKAAYKRRIGKRLRFAEAKKYIKDQYPLDARLRLSTYLKS